MNWYDWNTGDIHGTLVKGNSGTGLDAARCFQKHEDTTVLLLNSHKTCF